MSDEVMMDLARYGGSGHAAAVLLSAHVLQPDFCNPIA
jgi:hypothetical protein